MSGLNLDNPCQHLISSQIIESAPPAPATQHLRSKRHIKVGWLTFAALELWMWFGMAGLDYQAGSLFPFRTAGWFVLGQIFCIPFFGFVAWVTVALFKRWPRVISILASVTLGLLLGTAVNDALPRQQLSRIIGTELLDDAEIETLKVSDSFGDGNHTEGTLVIGPEFVKILQADQGFELVKRHPAPSHFRTPGTIYSGKRAVLRIALDEKRCFVKSQYVNAGPKPAKQ